MKRSGSHVVCLLVERVSQLELTLDLHFWPCRQLLEHVPLHIIICLLSMHVFHRQLSVFKIHPLLLLLQMYSVYICHKISNL